MMTICIPCGYIYQADEPFESLPESWCCPGCGASLNSFAEIDESLPQMVKKE
jgi:rubredoxin